MTQATHRLKLVMVVDPQNDFCHEKGSLRVPGSQAEDVRQSMMNVASRGDVVIGTADCHPKNHGGFARGGLEAFTSLVKLKFNKALQRVWPSHCVAGTDGAKYITDKDQDGHTLGSYLHYMEPKGMNPQKEEYAKSADSKIAVMIAEAKSKGYDPKDVEFQVVVCGVAENYCVAANAEQMLQGFKDRGLKATVAIAVDATKGVYDEKDPQARNGFLQRMEKHGIEVKSTESLMGSGLLSKEKKTPTEKPLGIIVEPENLRTIGLTRESSQVDVARAVQTSLFRDTDPAFQRTAVLAGPDVAQIGTHLEKEIAKKGIGTEAISLAQEVFSKMGITRKHTPAARITQAPEQVTSF